MEGRLATCAAKRGAFDSRWPSEERSREAASTARGLCVSLKKETDV